MLSPLPTVETACAAMQQEESQKEILHHTTLGDNDAMAMFGKGVKEKGLICTVCGRRGHTNDKCWGVVGYPKWYSKPKPTQRAAPGKWTGQRPSAPRMANNVQGSVEDQQNITMMSQQLEQILKLIPKERSNQKGPETDEKIDYGFSGMVHSGGKKVMGGADWIIDSGASDYMASSLQHMINIKLVPATFTITLPTGSTAVITHIGDVILENGLKLKNVLHPSVQS